MPPFSDKEFTRRFESPIIFLFVALLGIGIASWLLISWRYNKVSTELTRREITTIFEGVLIYVEDNSAFPRDLSCLEKDEWARTFMERFRVGNERREKWDTRIMRRFGVAPSIDLSDVAYMQPTSKPYSLSHIFYTPEVWAALWNLYGEFEYYDVDYVGKYGLLDPVEGFPPDELIVLAYSEGNGEEGAYIHTLYGGTELLSREKVNELLALQNAFLRRSVDESDIEFLLKGLNHSNSGFRFRSAEALAKLGRPEGRGFLDRQFESDDAYLKVCAADALARLGDREAIDFLQGPAQESDHKYIRIFAETTLREIGEWQPTETQFYTDERWKKHEAGERCTLPLFEEDIEKRLYQDMSQIQSDYLKLRRGK